MKRHLFLIFITIAALVIACGEAEEPFFSFPGSTQGTTYLVTCERVPGSEPEKIRDGVEELLKRFDYSLSTYNPASLLSAVNSNRDTVVDETFRDVFQRATEIWEMSDGLFDITAGPLVNAWGFGPDAIKRFDESRLDSLMELVGMEKVAITEGKVVKKYPGMFIDMNAIAQGYSVDLISQYLESAGASNYLVEVGGEVFARGKRGTRRWRVGIDRPTDNNMVAGSDLQAVIELEDRALATSGNYRRFYEEDGVKYSHTIDPSTGYPVRHQLLSATIVADDCMTADAFATACMAGGLEKAVEMIEKYPFLEGYLVYSDDEGNFLVWMSEPIRDLILE
jgi:thiamine biosynthesis lipoprotein